MLIVHALPTLIGPRVRVFTTHSVNSDFASTEDRRSISGNLGAIGGCITDWQSQTQHTVSLSSAEAEHLRYSASFFPFRRCSNYPVTRSILFLYCSKIIDQTSDFRRYTCTHKKILTLHRCLHWYELISTPKSCSILGLHWPQLTYLFDDAGIHIVSEVFVNLCCFLVNTLVKGVIRSFESLVKIQKWNVFHKTSSNNTPEFCHFSKPWVIDIKL